MLLSPELLCLLMFFTACGVLLLGFPVAFTLAGTSFAFAIIGYFTSGFDLSILYAFPQRIFGNVIRNEVLIAVPLFIFMGIVLERSKIAEELLESMGRLFGRLPGGIAFSVVLVGGLMAASTGIVGATVVAMGLLSLPTMLKHGYSKSLACGSITASGTLGQIIPPSIVLILLGDQLSSAYQEAQFEMGIFAPDTVSVNDLFAGALFPGLLLIGLYLVYLLIIAWLKPEIMPPLKITTTTTISKLIKTLIAPLLLIVLVLGSILSGLASPTEASSVGAIGALMLAGFKARSGNRFLIIGGVLAFALLIILTLLFDLRVQRNTIDLTSWALIILALLLTIFLIVGIISALLSCYRVHTDDGESVLVSSLRTSVSLSTKIMVIIIGAAMFSLVFRGLNGDEYVEHFLVNLPGGPVAAILFVMLVMFILGFFLDFLEIIFIVVPVVAPILLQLEFANGDAISPVWLGIMMAVNLQTSFLTPPFGFALFYLRGVAPAEVRTIDMYKGVIPFIIIQLLALIVLGYFPEIATWLPSLLYQS